MVIVVTGCLEKRLRRLYEIYDDEHVPDSNKPSSRGLLVFVCYPNHVCRASSSNCFHYSTKLIIPLLEKVHLVYEPVRRRGKEKAFREVPCKR